MLLNKYKSAHLALISYLLVLNTAFSQTTYTVTLSSDTVFSGGYVGGQPGELRYALNQIMNNQAQGVTDSWVIDFASDMTITLNDALPIVNLFSPDPVTIGDGIRNITIVGQQNPPTPPPSKLSVPPTRGLFIRQGNVTVNNLTFQNCIARGGIAYTGGAGGGLGGALFIDQANVTANNCNFYSCQAIGGSVGTPVENNGGGGGMGGEGAGGFINIQFHGGGGIRGNGAVGGGGAGGDGGGPIDLFDTGGGGGAIIGAVGGETNTAGTSVPGYVFGGGGGVGASGGGTGGGTSGGITNGGGGGGLNGSSTITENGGNGGIGGGGGGGDNSGPSDGGHGGIGGGGGASWVGGRAGDGGYGGGGGSGAAGSIAGDGGFGGGGGGNGGAAATVNNGVGGFGGGGGAAGVAGGAGAHGGFAGGGGGGSNNTAAVGTGGIGGTSGVNTLVIAHGQGGAGAAFGGAVFVGSSNTSPSGSLTFMGNTTFGSPGSMNSVTAGTGAQNKQGGAAGSDLFIYSGSAGGSPGTVVFSPGADKIITLNGTIADDSTTSLSVAGAQYTLPTNQSLGGSITLNGAGILLLPAGATHTYAGVTDVRAGTLILNGTIAPLAAGAIPPLGGRIIVSEGATLMGSGTINRTVTNSGTIAPGAPLTIATLSLQPSSIMDITISPTATSEITLTSVATPSTLDGALVVDIPSELTSGTATILTTNAGGIGYTGTFSNFPNNMIVGFSTSNEHQFTVTYDSNKNVILNFFLTQIPMTGLKGNNKKVATFLNTLTPSQATILVAPLGDSTRSNALEAISPGRTASLIFGVNLMNFSILDRLGNHDLLRRQKRKQRPALASTADALQEIFGEKGQLLAENQITPTGQMRTAARPENKNNDIWFDAFGDFLYQAAQEQTPSFHTATGGGMIGWDHFSENGFGGLFGGYAHLSLHNGKSLGDASSNEFFLCPHFTTNWAKGYLELAVFWSWNNMKNEREIYFPGFSTSTKGSFWSTQLTPHLGLGYDFSWDSSVLEPYVAFDWANNWVESFSEKGGTVYPMNIKVNNASLLRSAAGIRAYQSRTKDTDEKEITWIVRETVGYVNQTSFGAGKVTASLIATPGSTLTVESFTKTQNFATWGLEWIYRVNNFWLSLNYQGQGGKGYLENTGFIELGGYF